MKVEPASHPAPHPVTTSSEGPTRQHVAVGDYTFDVTLAGPLNGRPALLLHGFPQTSWSWRHVIPRLVGAGRRVVTVDQRGYSAGARPDAVEQYRGEHLVDDVLGLLQELDLHAVDLVGHDWGAVVAWQVAGAAPEQIRTLTALSVPHPAAFAEALTVDPDQQARSGYMLDFASPGYERTLLADDAAKLRALFGVDTGVDVEHVVRHLGNPEALRRALNWYTAQSFERAQATPCIVVPTMHIWSDQDWALGEYGALATERYVTGPYELVTLTGVSHWIPEHAPERTAELILRHTRAFA